MGTGSVPDRFDDRWRAAEQLRESLRHATYFLRRIDGAGTLTSHQTSVLAMLRHGGLRVSRIAANLGVRVPTATQSIGRLVDAGLAERTRDADDARAVVVVLTERGRAALEDESALRTAVVADALAMLDAGELARLRAALPLLDRIARSDEAGRSLAGARTTDRTREREGEGEEA